MIKETHVITTKKEKLVKQVFAELVAAVEPNPQTPYGNVNPGSGIESRVCPLKCLSQGRCPRTNARALQRTLVRTFCRMFQG